MPYEPPLTITPQLLSQVTELAFLPVESVIRDQQADYYAALAASDKAADSAPFLHFMIPTLAMAIRKLNSDPVGP